MSLWLSLNTLVRFLSNVLRFFFFIWFIWFIFMSLNTLARVLPSLLKLLFVCPVYWSCYLFCCEILYVSQHLGQVFAECLEAFYFSFYVSKHLGQVFVQCLDVFAHEQRLVVELVHGSWYIIFMCVCMYIYAYVILTLLNYIILTCRRACPWILIHYIYVCVYVCIYAYVYI